MQARKEGEYARFNLPLEEEKFSIKKALSDLAFSDAKCHKGEPEEIVYEVRDWFYETGYTSIDSPSKIWDNYNFFYSDLYDKKQSEGFSKKAIERLPVAEFLDEIKEWSNYNT